jgi:hypothetical protein
VRLSVTTSLLAGVLTFSCALETHPARFDVPPRENFESVSTALGAQCGSLDCHGRVEQSMRLYGKYGLRLASDDVPGGQDASAAEHDANYQSVTSLEPELLSRVWRDAGARAGRLTLVRKARGAEEHEGGAVFPPGGAGDRCLTSWLKGIVDETACGTVLLPLESPPDP